MSCAFRHENRQGVTAIYPLVPCSCIIARNLLQDRAAPVCSLTTKSWLTTDKTRCFPLFGCCLSDSSMSWSYPIKVYIGSSEVEQLRKKDETITTRYPKHVCKEHCPIQPHFFCATLVRRGRPLSWYISAFFLTEYIYIYIKNQN